MKGRNLLQEVGLAGKKFYKLKIQRSQKRGKVKERSFILDTFLDV